MNMKKNRLKRRMNKSNCFFGAVAIKYKFGGRIEWRSGWANNRGLHGFLADPWGHFRVRLSNHYLSYSSKDKNLSVCNQLWFAGYIKYTKIEV